MKRLITAALALSVLATAASAQPRPDQRDQRDNRPQQQQDHRGADNHGNMGAMGGPRADHDNRGPDRNDNGYERRADRRYKIGAYHAPRGYKTPQARRGQKLAQAYRGNAYVVDYRRYNLSAPPRGYQYVRVNNDVALTAISTGVITSVILQLFQ